MTPSRKRSKPRRKGIVISIAHCLCGCGEKWVIGKQHGRLAAFSHCRDLLICAGMPADKVPKNLRIFVTEEK